jgi:transposase-like protein
MTSIIEVYRRWPTHTDCIAHLERVKWGESPTCPYCGADKIARHRELVRDDRWQCSICHKSFAVTVGTIFHNTHVDLQRWFLLISLMLSAKKGLSAMQAARDLEMRRPTVWSMLKNLRRASRADHVLATRLIGEQWNPVLGFDGLYEISSLGTIRSLRGEKIKAPQRNPRGYMHTALYDHGATNVYIHRAVLEAFAGAAPHGQESCHWNGQRDDNSLLNLRWDTSKGNHADRLVHGTHTRGSRNAKAKLTDADVLAIRAAVAGGTMPSVVARSYGVNKCTISDIVRGRTWQWL